MFVFANFVRVNARGLTTVSRFNIRSLSLHASIARPTLLPKTLHSHATSRWMSDAAQPRKVLYFGNLPFTMSEDDIMRELQDFGPIKHVYKGTDPATRQSSGWAVVQFETEDVAESILRNHQAQPFIFDGRVAMLSWAKNQNIPSVASRKRSDRAPSPTLFVSNIHMMASEDDLRILFEAYGPLQRVSIRRSESGIPRGFAHIQYSDVGSAVAAYEASLTSPITILGRPMVVDYNLPHPPRDPGR